MLRLMPRRVRAFIDARFDPKAYLGLHLTLALVLAALGLWAFGALLDAVLDNATLVRFDLAAATWIHDHVTPAGLSAFVWITRIGSPPSMVALAVIGAAVLWYQQRRMVLIAWIAATAGGALLDSGLKMAVHRTRPVYAGAYLHGQSFSFPSGHAMGSIIGIGMLLYVLGMYWHPSQSVHRLSVIVGVILIALVGISRIYLGVHYPSDVLGGWAAGAAWAAVCISGVAIARHRHPAPVSAANDPVIDDVATRR